MSLSSSATVQGLYGIDLLIPSEFESGFALAAAAVSEDIRPRNEAGDRVPHFFSITLRSGCLLCSRLDILTLIDSNPETRLAEVPIHVLRQLC